MSICLLAAAAIAAATLPSRAAPMPRVTIINTARVTILRTEKIAPIDRNARYKGHDRSVQRRGKLTLIEFY